MIEILPRFWLLSPYGPWQLKKDPFALHGNYSFEIVILAMFLKNCQNLFSFALLIMPIALSGGGRGGWGAGGGLLNVLSLLRLSI